LTGYRRVVYMRRVTAPNMLVSVNSHVSASFSLAFSLEAFQCFFAFYASLAHAKVNVNVNMFAH